MGRGSGRHQRLVGERWVLALFPRIPISYCSLPEHAIRKLARLYRDRMHFSISRKQNALL